ncbi:hypothetical protein [Flintibacter muris]|uniref:hypothetical protein n=1 Tax=Flintibacter muris TaxID=2941327 RepID=UPI00203E5805|nr:hypothetical protein [Flintibacter muris]
MKTEYDADAAFLYPYTGEQERRFFYALMLRSRGEKGSEWGAARALWQVPECFGSVKSYAQNSLQALANKISQQ